MEGKDPFYPIKIKGELVNGGIKIRDELASRIAQGFASDARNLENVTAAVKAGCKVQLRDVLDGDFIAKQSNKAIARMSYGLADALVEESNAKGDS